jgi:glycosyltransferase involved in cell wall biosynthesis
VLDKLRHRPFVIHFHGPWALEGAAEGARRPVIFAKHLLERIVYSRGVKLIVLSKAFGSILEQQYGVPPDAIRIVPGGVDLDQFQCSLSRNAARQQLGLPLDRPTIVSVRRLVRAKGIENLIDATAILRKRIPDILVVVAGTGPLANDLALRVQERGLSESLRFAGYVAETDLPTLYRAADLFVVPTIALEGFGLVVVEALACGTPVIVTPVAGLPEVITDLDPSLVLAGSDSETLARGIGDAITGQTPLPNSHACTAYAQRFGWSQIAQRVADIYRDAR